MSLEPADIHAAIDNARAVEREQRDARTRDQLDQIDRLSQALAADRPRTVDELDTI